MRNNIMSETNWNPNVHASLLGKTIANIQAIEFVIRDLLFVEERGLKYVKKFNKTLELLKNNDIVETNSFTNYDTLTKLIIKYNNLIRPIDDKLCIGSDIVTLRDLIAHGRFFALSQLPPFLILLPEDKLNLSLS